MVFHRVDVILVCPVILLPILRAVLQAGAEDEEEGGFFQRHLRGIVSLALLGILILLFVIYAFSRSGQLTLAKANLAWSTDAYSQLGYQSYQDQQYAEAGL